MKKNISRVRKIDKKKVSALLSVGVLFLAGVPYPYCSTLTGETQTRKHNQFAG